MSTLASILPSARHVADAASRLPRAPRRLADLQLPIEFLEDLVLKVVSLHVRQSPRALAEETCLPPSIAVELLAQLRAERLVEIGRGGPTEADHEHQLTERGRALAAEAMRRSLYAGPVPVTLEEYRATVAAQSVSQQRFSARAVRAAFDGTTIPNELVDRVGAALNSGRAILIHGQAGSGKTYLGEQVQRLLPGTITVPHALYVGHEVVQVYDPTVHRPADTAAADPGRVMRADVDRRWVKCYRPFVVTGGELSIRMLDLQFDEVSRFYQAPPHVKANGGMLLVDDLGRQQISPQDLMNRWITPLDRQHDYLTTHTGFKFSVPFDLALIFSTNLSPAAIADEAFLRRFGYKIHVGPVDAAVYRKIFENVCAASGVPFDAPSFDWLLNSRHPASGRPLLASYPRDLIGRIRELAEYEESPAAMTTEALDRAWSTYFVTAEPADAPHAADTALVRPESR